MGGMPEFKFPKDLADCWWKPVVKAGMILTLHKDMSAYEKDQQWGGCIKTIPGHDADLEIVDSFFVKEDKTFENGMRSTLVTPTMNRQHNRYLMAISRIVVASGARIIDGRYGWKIMYVSDSPIADRVLQSLCEHPQLNLRRIFPGDPLVVEKNGWLVENYFRSTESTHSFWAWNQSQNPGGKFIRRDRFPMAEVVWEGQCQTIDSNLRTKH